MDVVVHAHGFFGHGGVFVFTEIRRGDLLAGMLIEIQVIRIIELVLAGIGPGNDGG